MDAVDELHVAPSGLEIRQVHRAFATDRGDEVAFGPPLVVLIGRG